MTISMRPCVACWVKTKSAANREQDAQAAYEAGAIYGGLIFVDSSPRAVSVEQARKVIAQLRSATWAFSATQILQTLRQSRRYP
jgi:phosphoribosylanthranilate isomerase